MVGISLSQPPALWILTLPLISSFPPALLNSDIFFNPFLDVDISGDMFTEEQNELVESAAEMLYGLIHVRYILTSKGMAAMVKFRVWSSVRVHC